MLRTCSGFHICKQNECITWPLHFFDNYYILTKVYFPGSKEYDDTNVEYGTNNSKEYDDINLEYGTNSILTAFLLRASICLKYVVM